jgi:pimeloyl-ACP methyl ester carboxylesterase
LKRIIIRLRHDISQSSHQREAFLGELSLLAGVPLDEIHQQDLRSGCTLFDGVLETPAVERLVEYFDKIKAGLPVDSPEAQMLSAFVDRWSVEVLTDDSWTKGVRATLPPSTITGSVIVLVHGWGGDRETTFGDLPKYLHQRPGVPVLVYEYPSDWFKKSPSVVFVARNLDNWIRNRIAGCRVGLVAHSLGGLVTRYLAVIQESRDHPLDIRQITLVASPTEGAVLATIAKHVPLLDKTQIQELHSNSPFLVDLNDRWVRWRKHFVPSPCHLGTIYGLDDKVVDYASAIGLDPEAAPIFGAGHMDIVKPPSIDHEVVLTISRFVQESGLANQL